MTSARVRAGGDAARVIERRRRASPAASIAWPWITMPSESPTSSTSTPARSAERGEARVVRGQHRDLRPVARHRASAGTVTRAAAGGSARGRRTASWASQADWPRLKNSRRPRIEAIRASSRSKWSGLSTKLSRSLLTISSGASSYGVEEAAVGVGEPRQVAARRSCARSRRRAGARARSASRPAPAGRRRGPASASAASGANRPSRRARTRRR